MNRPFALENPTQAVAFLRSFPRVTRNKGEALFRREKITEIICVTPGRMFTVHFSESDPCVVTLDFSSRDRWHGECTCLAAAPCKHVYAAMKTLLAESSLESVQSLSAGLKPAQVTTAPATFADEVAAACGRPLAPKETRFLAKLNEVYGRCRISRQISGWDFQDLGLQVAHPRWDIMHIWPAFPKTEREFWLYVANAVLERKGTLPSFMECVTDLAPVKEALRRWERNREITQWKQLLGGSTDGVALDRGTHGKLDLRLRFLEKAAIIELLRQGRDEFQPIKAQELSQITEDLNEGLVQLPPEAELIWHVFAQRLLYGRSTELVYADLEARRNLARLFKLPLLESRLVTAEGQPFQRPNESLRWDLSSPPTDEGDYRLRMVQADGRPVPPILCVFPGRPPIYLTENQLFHGPPVNPALDPRRENVVPAPAMESRGGVEVLHALQVPLPDRLRDRVRVTPLQLSIACELGPKYPGSTSEICFVRVQGESQDGIVHELWNGSTWSKSIQSKNRPVLQADERELEFHDRSALFDAPSLLEPLGLKFDPFKACLSVRVTKQFPETFTTWLKSIPPHVSVRLAGELSSLTNAALAGKLRLDITETTIDWFDLRVIIDVEDTTLTSEELKLLLDARGKYVRLESKGWRRLEFDLDQEEDERLARLGLSPHEMTSEPQRLHALQLADGAARKFLPEQQVERIQRRATEIKARVTPDLPSTINADLRPYQLDGFHFLAYLSTNHFGGILADDMGLGKTLQTLAWLMWLREQAAQKGEQIRPSLVVCPKSVMDNWRAESARFASTLRVKAWPASELPGLLEHLAEADIHVLNYSQLRLLGESLAPIHWLAVILDEGQYIKNPNSQTAQIARALRTDHRLVLTGTPIENRLLDLWSLMAFAMPGVLGSRALFARMFDAKEDPFARRRLAARVRPFLLRRTKTQVAKDLPDRIEEDLFCEIEGEQRLLYRAELKRAQQMLLKVKTQKQLAKDRFHFLTSLLRLRQICCHPRLVDPTTKASGAKLDALLEQLEPLMEEGQKVLVFSQFVELLGLLRTALEAKGWPIFYLAGDTENRGELVHSFQSASGNAVFLISLKAGGFGLNLTAASYVVLFDPWWNPAVENQAIDRTHRIGQTSKVIAYRLLIKDSIEEKIRAMQKQKSALADDVLGEEKFSQSLTLDDLQFLFAD